MEKRSFLLMTESGQLIDCGRSSGAEEHQTRPETSAKRKQCTIICLILFPKQLEGHRTHTKGIGIS